jgi:hypothetical protein
MKEAGDHCTVNIKQTLSIANKVVPLQINLFRWNRGKEQGARVKDTLP